MSSSIEPIFLFSLPRSGSTLLQRILAKHRAIDTAAEPWILLPLFSSMRSTGIYTNYDQNAVVEAIKDFYGGMEGGKATFQKEIRELLLRLYARRSRDDARYFLDKTPRYHLIVDEILETFPNARFIFLWRNPLSIIASMLDTWHRGHWYLYFFKIDLYVGLDNLIRAFGANQDRVLGIQYEHLLTNPETACREICAYLDIPYHQAMIEDFQSVNLAGEMGDPTGVKAYSSISAQPLDKWKASLRNPLRKAWCRQYLNWLGPDRLETMGYHYEELVRDLQKTPPSLKRIGGDLMRITYGVFYQIFELRLFQDKLKHLSRFREIHPHL